MNAYQFIMAVFSLVSIATSLGALIVIVRSRTIKRKALWFIGSLFGFVGLAVNWSAPDDIYLQFGISIPVFQFFKILPNGPVIVKTLFPFVAAFVLVREYDESTATK